MLQLPRRPGLQMKLTFRWRRHLEHITIAGLHCLALRHECTDENAPWRYDIPKETARMPIGAGRLHGMLRRQTEIGSWNPV